LPDYGIEKSFHKLGQVYDWKIKSYLTIFLALRDDFSEELTVAASAPRSSGERTGSIAPARITACQTAAPPPLRFPAFRKIGVCAVRSSLWWTVRTSGFRLGEQTRGGPLRAIPHLCWGNSGKTGLADFQCLHNVAMRVFS